jgi:hypothetical protein
MSCYGLRVHLFLDHFACKISQLSFSSCLSAMTFKQCGRFINPARISPRDLLVCTLPGGGQRQQLYTSDRRPAICVSAVYCSDSCITQPSTRGLGQKSISGIYHTQEYERTVGLVCTCFEQPVLHAQIYKDAMQFATRARSRSRAGTSNNFLSLVLSFISVS